MGEATKLSQDDLKRYKLKGDILRGLEILETDEVRRLLSTPMDWFNPEDDDELD